MFKEVKTAADLKKFYKVSEEVYAGDSNYRDSEKSLVEMLVEGKSMFYKHATIKSFLILSGDDVVGRFSLIHDNKMKEFVQVAFFEAKPGLLCVEESVKALAKSTYPTCSKIVVGFNGHLNYGVGFLANKFDEPPTFGLPYTKEYYLSYFPTLERKNLFTYKIKNRYFIWANKIGLFKKGNNEIKIRHMDKKNIKREIEIYTDLNNACFKKHPYWSDRAYEEDAELFKEFKMLLTNDNLLIAELDGKPIGFLLWYPDFNKLTEKSLNVFHFLKFKLKGLKHIRLTEVAVLPEYRRMGVMTALISELSRIVGERKFPYTEAGFIFESNKGSVGFSKSVIKIATGMIMKPNKKFVVLEGTL